MTYVTTGESLTITIDGDDFSPQTSSVELAYEANVETYRVLTGSTAIKTGTAGTLTVNMFQDYGQATSLCEALWLAADAGTAVTFVLTAGGAAGTTYSGSVVPQYPTVGGAADSALEASISLVVSGVVTMDTTP